ncbi:MAG: HAD-IB family phosphatase [Bacillota bacterium]
MLDKIAYVLDFDGTITIKDISKELAIHYNEDRFWIIHNAYKNGELGMRDWLEQSAALLPSNYNQLITTALSYATVRPGFIEFIDYATLQSRPVVIASDGFGFYIEPILESAGILDKITSIYRNDLELEHQSSP